MALGAYWEGSWEGFAANRSSRTKPDANVPDRTAMELTGHLTWKVFDAYNIVNDEDKRNGVAKLGLYLAKQREDWSEKERGPAYVIG